MALPEEARMEAEDTVLEGEHLADLVAMDNAAGPVDTMGRQGEEKREAAMLQAQAKTTWPIAYKAGIREAVKWIDKTKDEEGYTDFNHQQKTNILLDKEELQAQLKAWGLKDGG